MRYAGRDATKAYSDVHTPNLIKTSLGPEKLKGVLDKSTIDDEWTKSPEPSGVEPNTTADNESQKTPLHTLISSYDIEAAAFRILSKKAWAFYSSAATDLITRDANRSCFDRIWFRPRVLRNVRSVDTRTAVVGVDSSLPLFVSPAAMAKLAHPDGECAIAKACESRGILQGVCMRKAYVAGQFTYPLTIIH